MIFRYYSDLHGYAPDFVRDTDKQEVCLLPGDVHEYGNKGTLLIEILKTMCDRFKHVVFTTGNHEYYGTSILRFHDKLTKAMEDVDNFTYLQNGSYIDFDNTRIIGATLWSDTSSINLLAKHLMNDYKRIRIGPSRSPYQRTLVPCNTTGLHREHRYQINLRILSTPEDMKIIVMTHHAPSYKSIATRFIGDKMNPAYATDIEMDKWPDYWIHGHIHEASNYMHNGCNVLCNPGGYIGEHTNFKLLGNSIKT